MNRLKLWLYALIVIGLAALGLRLLTVEQSRAGLDATDRQLLAAQARVDAAERASLQELAALAALAAQDGKLQAAFHAGPDAGAGAVKPPPKKGAPPPPPPPTADQLDGAIDQAAAEAVVGALQATGPAKLDRVVLAATRDVLVRKPPADPDATAFLQDALDRKVRRGYAVLGGKLFAGAAVPAGDRGALAVFVPVDTAWVAEKVGDTRAVAVLAVSKKAQVTSSVKLDATALMQASTRGLVPVDAGRLERIDVRPTWLPFKLPPVAPLLDKYPSDRVVTRPLIGLPDGRLVVALATRPALEPVVRLEWYGLAALLVALLLAVPFGLLVKPTEVAAALPPILLEAARKIEKGDFSVRAPVLAGKLGTLAAALNKAVDAATSGPQTPVSSVTSEFFARGPVPAEPADPFALPVRPARTAAVIPPAPSPEPQAADDTARLDGANLSGAAFEAAPVAAPRPATRAVPRAAPAPAAQPPPAAAPAPARPTPAPVPVAAAPDLLASAAAAAPAGEAGEEEQHWREVFRDFVRTRGECGETAEGLTYERFRQKLESNKSALVTKYGCKTVRFQVYVKDGKAALKATPVR